MCAEPLLERPFDRLHGLWLQILARGSGSRTPGPVRSNWGRGRLGRKIAFSIPPSQGFQARGEPRRDDRGETRVLVDARAGVEVQIAGRLWYVCWMERAGDEVDIVEYTLAGPKGLARVPVEDIELVGDAPEAGCQRRA